MRWYALSEKEENSSTPVLFVKPDRESLAQWFSTFFTYLTLISKNISRFTLPQVTQSCSWIENTKLTNSYGLEWFIKIYTGCHFQFSTFTPLEDEIYPQG